MFLYFFSAIFKSVKAIAAKIPANGHVESGLIIDLIVKYTLEGQILLMLQQRLF